MTRQIPWGAIFACVYVHVRRWAYAEWTRLKPELFSEVFIDQVLFTYGMIHIWKPHQMCTNLIFSEYLQVTRTVFEDVWEFRRHRLPPYRPASTLEQGIRNGPRRKTIAPTTRKNWFFSVSSDPWLFGTTLSSACQSRAVAFLHRSLPTKSSVKVIFYKHWEALHITTQRSLFPSILFRVTSKHVANSLNINQPDSMQTPKKIMRKIVH